MTNPESHKTEIYVGIFVLLGLAVISVLVFAIAGKQKLFEPRYRLTAIFSQVAGLKVGSPIRLAGLEVGSVESLNFTPSGKVLATLSLQARYRGQIRGDSVATISSVGILGDKSVEITIGTKESKKLRAGARIETKDPFDVAEFVDNVGPMAEKVDEILTYLSKVTSDFSMETLHLSDTLKHANNILMKVDAGEGSIGAALNNPSLHNELVSLARSGREAANQMKETLGQFETASEDLPALMSSTRKAMDDISTISRDLRNSTERFPVIAEHVDDSVRNMRTATQDLPAISGSFRRTARGAEDVMEAAKKSWFIRRNLPVQPTSEEKIILDNSPFLYKEIEP